MIRYIIGSVFGGFIALISAYFKGKSTANKENYSKKIEEDNEILKVKINKHKKDIVIDKEINEKINNHNSRNELIDSLLANEK